MAETSDVLRSAQRTLGVLGRTGWVINAVQHILVAVLALQIAWSRSNAHASHSGALATVAAQPFGHAALVLFVAGFAGLALVHLARCIGVRGHDAATQRAQAGALAGYYTALAVLAEQYAQGAGGGASARDVTAYALSWPGGQLLVGVVGLVIVGIGVYHVVKGQREGFRDELDCRDRSGRSGIALERIAQFGYVTKGLALLLVGVLVVIGAVRFDPNAGGGLDAALRVLVGQPYGPWLLSLVALGLVAFAGYLVIRARRGKV